MSSVEHLWHVILIWMPQEEEKKRICFWNWNWNKKNKLLDKNNNIRWTILWYIFLASKGQDRKKREFTWNHQTSSQIKIKNEEEPKKKREGKLQEKQNQTLVQVSSNIFFSFTRVCDTTTTTKFLEREL